MSARSEDKLNQYFIALVPPSPVYDEALRLKNYFRDQYNSKASLNSPPHITMHMPFRWREQKENELIDSLKDFCLGRQRFKLDLFNFGAFPPRVIFIDVIVNDELAQLNKDLQRFCRRDLNLFNASYKDQAFHPHLTLAFRDLKKPMFLKAWEEFQERKFSASFSVDKLVLLKHNGKVWDVFREFGFEPSSSPEDEAPNPLEMHK